MTMTYNSPHRLTASVQDPVLEAVTHSRGAAECRFCHLCDPHREHMSPWDHIIISSRTFLVVPSKGALVPGWLMVIPRRHVLSTSVMTKDEFKDLHDILAETKAIVADTFGPPTVFEHGAACANTTFGCGIDHAHVHVVPLPFHLRTAVQSSVDVEWSQSEDEFLKVTSTLRAPYVAFSGPDLATWVATPNNIPRQFFRRMIATRLGRPDQFDYDQYPEPSNAVQTLSRMTATIEEPNTTGVHVLRDG